MYEQFTIYALVDAEGVFQYIGYTENTERRSRQHRKRWPELTFRTIGKRSTLWRALTHERAMILKHQPPLNVMYTKIRRGAPSRHADNRQALAKAAHLRSVGIHT